MAKIHKIDNEKKSAALMDVVFIHGLNGNAFETWTHSNKNFWPEWLRKDLPEADCWTIDYNATDLKWKRAAPDFFSQSDIITNYLKDHGIGSRPLCFICHSLGGLITKQILRASNERNSQKQNCLLYKNTQSVVFLATPHKGSKIASVIDKIKGLLQTNQIVSYLKSNEVYINDLFEFFLQTKIPSISFYETEKSPILPKRVPLKCYSWLNRPIVGIPFFKEIVSKDSARAGIDKPIPVETNHFDICKFCDSNHLVYKKIISFVRENFPGANLPSIKNTVPLSSVESQIQLNQVEIHLNINDGNWNKAYGLINKSESILDLHNGLLCREAKYLKLAEFVMEIIEGEGTCSELQNKLKKLLEKAGNKNVCK